MWKTVIKTLHVPSDVIAKYEEALRLDDGTAEGAQRAAPLFKECADAGHDRAQVRYADMCRAGEGVKQSNKSAYRYYKMAAINYNWTGKLEVGICYLLGIGTIKSGLNAGFHLKRCANRLMPKGQFYYAKLLAQGQLFSVKKDAELAIAYMAAAAVSGYAGADEELQLLLATVTTEGLWKRYRELCGKKKFLAPGLLYALAALGDANAMYLFADNVFRGDGFPRDHSAAFRFAKMAADRKCVQAYQLLAYLFLKGLGTERDDEKAFHYYKLAADEGCDNAHFNLGLMYLRGIGVSVDYGMAFQAFQNGAMVNSPQALYLLAQLYRDGKGVDADIEKYLENLEKAADLNFFKAIHEYAFYCFEHQDFKKAMKYMYMASKYGDADSYLYIGEMLEKGLGIEVSLENALSWYKLGIFMNEDAECYFRVANFYENGMGVEKNLIEAKNLYEKAALKNHEKAMIKYDELKNIT